MKLKKLFKRLIAWFNNNLRVINNFCIGLQINITSNDKYISGPNMSERNTGSIRGIYPGVRITAILEHRDKYGRLIQSE